MMIDTNQGEGNRLVPTGTVATAEPSSGDKKALLQVKELKTYFPILGGVLRRTVGYVQAVDGISFDVYPSETLGLVGESGCGKTTTGRTILRLAKATAGQVVFEGRDVFSLPNNEMTKLRAQMQ